MKPPEISTVTWTRLLIVFLVIWVLTPADRIHDVDAFYYPDRSDLSTAVTRLNVGSVEACRAWVELQATKRGDPTVDVGDYECGIGPKRKWPNEDGPLTVYADTVQ